MNEGAPKKEEQKSKIGFTDDMVPIKDFYDKLKEYKERLETQQQEYPNQPPEFFTDTIYKIAVLERLLAEGEVNTHELGRELKEEYGTLNVSDFNNACGVIEDYIETGGRRSMGGTGFGSKRE